jgi:predicted secreted protein
MFLPEDFGAGAHLPEFYDRITPHLGSILAQYLAQKAAAEMNPDAVTPISPRRLVLGATLAVAALIIALPVSAAPQESDQGLTVLHLSESADRAIRRDRLRAQLRVEATGSSAKQVQTEINRRMTAALEKVKAVAGIKLETGGYSVYEERQQNVASRWRGSQGLTLLDRDFSELLAIVGDLQSDGLAVSSLSFELLPETARGAQDELTTEALKRLSDRAERIAADLHLTIVRYRDIKVSNVGGDRPIRAMAMGAAQSPQPVAEAGDAIVQVSVDAEVVLGASDDKGP